ncbi:MAG: family 16 glycosylhydrolase [Myxococcales bacterium]
MLAALGACLATGRVEAKPYKGAEILSLNQQKFGRIEVRMRMARGAGILSTFFTYKPGSEGAGALWEEIDIEVFGKSNATSWQSNILVGNPRMGSEQVHDAGVSLADGYHTFTIEWTPTAVVWKLDGAQVRRTDGGQANQLVSPHAFHFNLWASDVASWAGAFESSSLPQAQYVNWIRYYRYDAGSFVLDWSDDFNTFDTARWSKGDWTFDGNLVDFDPNNAVVKDSTLVLCMTAEGQTGCSGAVPPDNAGGLGGGGSGGAAGTGGGGGGSGGSGGVSSAGGASGAAGNGGAPASGGVTANGGVTAAGGAAGSGGATSVAGTAGSSAAGASSGGAPTSGGTPGSAGSTTVGVAGSVTSAGGAAATLPAVDNGGCGCVVAGGSNHNPSGPWLALAALLQAARVRRKRKLGVTVRAARST